MASTSVRYDILAVDRASSTFSRVGAAAAASQRKIAATNKAMITTGKKLTRNVSVPLLAIGGYAVKSASDFQAQMQRIQTQAGGSAKDVQQLSKAVLNIKNAQQGPQELAAALYHLKSVGMGNAQAMKALHGSMKLANVGGADLEETTNAIAGAWRTGIKGARNFGHAAALVNSTVGAGNMKMQDYIDALGTGLLPTAKTAGLTLRDVGGALALFTDENVPARAAATRLGTALQLMAAPSDKANKALAGIGLRGIQLAETMQKPNGLIKALDLIKGHLQGLDKAHQFDVISRAFGGAKGAKTVMSMLNNLDVLKGKMRQVDAGAGRFGQDVAKQAQTSSAKFHMLTASLQQMGVKLGNQLLPLVLKMVTKVSSALSWFSRQPDWFKKLAGGAAAFAIALGPVMTMTGRLRTAFTFLGAAMTKSGRQSAEVQGKLTNLKASARGLASTAGLFAVTDGLHRTSGALSTLETTAGGAAIGFSVGGPLGAAIGGTAGLLVGLGRDIFSTSHKYADLAKALNQKIVAHIDASAVQNLIHLLAQAHDDYRKISADAARQALDQTLSPQQQHSITATTGLSTTTLAEAHARNPQAIKLETQAYSKLRGELGKLTTAEKGLSFFMDHPSYEYTGVNAAGATDWIKKLAAAERNGILTSQQFSKAQRLINAAFSDGVLTQDEYAKIQKIAAQAYGNGKNRALSYREALQALKKTLGTSAAAQKEINKNVDAAAKAFGMTAAQVKKLPSKVAVDIEEHGLPQTNQEAASLLQKFGKLLTFKELRSVITLPGIKLSQTQLDKYLRTVHATPKQIATAYKSEGIPVSARMLRALQHQMGLTPKQIQTVAQLLGVKLTHGQIDGILRSLHGLNGTTASPRVTLDTSQVRSAVAGVRLMLAALNGDIATVYTQTVNLGGGRKKAAGGPIYGPGTSTSDSINARLSNGEYVINARQTSKYRGLLDSINYGRNGYAGGGPVGGKRGSGSVAGVPPINLSFPEGMTLMVGDMEFDAYIDARIDDRISA